MSTDPTSTHVREWELRRRAAGELDAAQEASLRAHLEHCEGCRTTERGTTERMAEEQRELEGALPFERFAQGVERILQPAPKRTSARMGRWVQGAVALAACVGMAVLAPKVLNVVGLRHDAGREGSDLAGHRPGNRLKGGAQVELRIAGAGDGPQRVAAAQTPEVLGPGERVRIGYRAGTHRFVAAISVDAQGEVSALYPESGQSLPAAAAPRLTYLPGSLEFTGQGPQRVIVVLSDTPLPMAQLTVAAKAAFHQANGDVSKLPALALPGEQFQRTLLEP